MNRSSDRLALGPYAAGSLAVPGQGGNLPVFLLPMRLVLFALFQLVIAAVIGMAGGRFDFSEAGIFWAYTAVGANVITFIVLRLALRREGLSVFDLYRFTKGSVGRDILAALVLFIVAAPVAFFPNSFLADVLFQSPEATTPFMFGRMPVVAAYLTILFPLTIAFAELPLYMGYILPRLESRLGSRAAAILIAGLFLALQHCTLPLILDVRFILWRFGMFLPLAMLFALALSWRPRLLPYMMISHALLDFATVPMFIAAALH